MTAKRGKKVQKYRGSKTHGGGSMKKRRGAGHRGGRGNAGSGKRADTNKPTVIKEGRHMGKYGFKKKNALKVKGVNIGWLNAKLKKLIETKKTQEKSGVYEIDLAKLGYNKLLSGGKATHKMSITATYASAKAEEKVKQAGGSLHILAKKEAPVAEQEQ
jgi:large subunit ribosomal protein L15